MYICEYGGCMSKLPAIQLKQMLDDAGANSLIEFQDCAILSETELLFATDFWYTCGKNCRDAGKIATLNALSDVYAMDETALYASVILFLGRGIEKKKFFCLLLQRRVRKKEWKQLVDIQFLASKQLLIQR